MLNKPAHGDSDPGEIRFIASSTPLEVGSVMRGISLGINGISEHYPDQPFAVVREATLEEWLRQCTARAPEVTRDRLLDFARTVPYIYQVALD